jgi:outer membrane protein assembly factor BamE (lipoprotein component of BamABCDE complex)
VRWRSGCGGLALLPLLTACSFFAAPIVPHGNRVDADMLKELVPGTSTRTDVTALLGSPTTRATFDDNQWIYVGQTVQSRIGQTPGVRSQDVVVLSFNDQGVLQGLKHLTLADSKPVAMAAGATPSPGSEASFMQQLLGNVGRFTAGAPGAGTIGGGGP